MPCSLTPLMRKVVSGILFLRTLFRNASCRLGVRSAILLLSVLFIRCHCGGCRSPSHPFVLCAPVGPAAAQHSPNSRQIHQRRTSTPFATRWDHYWAAKLRELFPVAAVRSALS